APVFLSEEVATGVASRLGMRLGRDTTVRLGEQARLKIDRFLVDAGGGGYCLIGLPDRRVPRWAQIGQAAQESPLPIIRKWPVLTPLSGWPNTIWAALPRLKATYSRRSVSRHATSLPTGGCTF